MAIPNSSITFVIQGPIIEHVTDASCAFIRSHFSGSKILVSTWEGQPIEGLDYDELLLNEDPGSTVYKFTKQNQPHTININRQIVSTLNGLKNVTTEYAVKLRSDNSLQSNRLLELYQQYQDSPQSPLQLSGRILTTNLFSKEYVEGLACPFFFSDFFMFGYTKDLLCYWSQPLKTDYIFRESLRGERQHERYPWPQLHIEQWLALNFIEKFTPVSLPHKYANQCNQIKLSRSILARHFIIAERSMIDLVVPERLDQREGFPYETFSHMRWLQLYEKYNETKIPIPPKVWFTIKWWFGRISMYITAGLKQHLRLLTCNLRAKQ